mgnify:CR=1 FL=1
MSDATGQAAEIKPGTTLPVEEKFFTAADLVMYGAATWDWHRLHYDTKFTETMNLPAPVIDGQIYGALFAKQAVGWLGPRAFEQRMGNRMRSKAYSDATLRTEGEVSEVRSEETAKVIVVQQRLTSGEQLIAEATTEIRVSQ